MRWRTRWSIRRATSTPAARSSVVMDVLLGLVGIVPRTSASKRPVSSLYSTRRSRSARCLPACGPSRRYASPSTGSPIRALPQIDGVVVTVREPEPHQEAPSRLEPERVDQFLSHQAHRGGAEDDDALLVEPDDALVGPEIEQFGELQIVAVRLNVGP